MFNEEFIKRKMSKIQSNHFVSHKNIKLKSFLFRTNQKDSSSSGNHPSSGTHFYSKYERNLATQSRHSVLLHTT